jgi:hypothetical protein
MLSDMLKTSIAASTFCATFLLLVSPALCQSDRLPAANSAPRIDDAALPHYPPIAEASHVTGKVTVLVTVQNGRVVRTKAESGSLAITRYLQPATVLNIQTWRFGNDVNKTFTVTYTYEISGEQSDGPANPRVEMLPSLDVKITARPTKLYCSDGCGPG